MHLSHLSLTNVRSFRRLELDLGPGSYVVVGENAEGKSNLLESMAMLATTRSVRPGADGELISWDALREEPLPAARLAGRVESATGSDTVEIAVAARALTAGAGHEVDAGSPSAGPAVVEGAPGAPSAQLPPTPAPTVQPPTSRRFRLNGVARRASDLVGTLRAVLFSAADLGVVAGPPAARRRYLDLTLSQLDAGYLRGAQRYARVLQQRNSLLRRLAERRGGADELDFWDQELAAAGAVLVAGRARALSRLATGAAERYAELAPGDAPLTPRYRPALPPDLAATLTGGDAAGTNVEALADALREALAERRREEVAAGMTRIGPHRDDVAFLLGGRELAAVGSRGQQRGAALALRLAEVALFRERTGEPPVLLLDDVLSELDAARRARVIEAAYDVEQLFVTTPDAERPPPGTLPAERRLRLVGGELRPIERDAP
jgi:DNA replication and repair protein RecF